MQLKQNPFSLYDFLGYFVPGAVFVSSVCVWAFFETSIPNSVAEGSVLSVTKSLSWYMNELQWFVSIVFIIASYIFGFAMSLVSGIVVEGYLILRKDYPSKFRFNCCPHDRETYLSKKDSCPWNNDCPPPFFMGKFKYVLDFFCCIVVLPVLVFDIVFGRWMKLERTYYKKFKKDELEMAKRTIEVIFHKIGLDVPSDLSKADYNWHKYIYHYVFENSTTHTSKIQNYVALYGFSRTVSMVFIFIFWTSIIAYYFNYVSYTLTPLVVHLLLFSTLAYVFFLGFTKFYRRYTDEIFMAAIAMHAKEKNSVVDCPSD